MDEEMTTPPVVLISYSHDSQEHKIWVRDLATALRGNGIDVILDQWEIGPGDDVPKFMEQSVRRALRVIMVCTEEYVRKADDGKGGAGYEAMVVTGELICDLGTRKFIPVIRQSGTKPVLPACVSTRYFVDFSKDEEFSEKLEALARDIHDAPQFEKPPLGKNPFTASAPKTDPSQVATSAISFPTDPYEIYELSQSYANAGNFAKWRELIHKEKVEAGTEMLRWKAENQKDMPNSQDDLPIFLLPGVATHSGLFAAAFGAFDSIDRRFHNQLSLLDRIRNPKDWQWTGPSVCVALPELVLFTYQALLGGLALSRQRPEMAYNLAATPLTDSYSPFARNHDTRPLFKNSRFTGWPDSLNHTCTTAWAFLQKAAKQWEWLWKLFGSEEDTVAAIAAYYLFLNTMDFVSAVKAKGEGVVEIREPKVPLFFSRGEDEILTRTQGVFFESTPYIAKMFSDNGIAADALLPLWNLWMKHCEKWLASVYSRTWLGVIPHSNLPQMLSRGGEKRLID